MPATQARHIPICCSAHGNDSRHSYKDNDAEGKHTIFQNEVLRSIAEKHQKTVAQIILRWLIQRGVVAIPKSVRIERIVENFDVFDIALSPEDLAAIGTLDTKTSSFFDHRDPAVVKRLGEAKRPS